MSDSKNPFYSGGGGGGYAEEKNPFSLGGGGGGGGGRNPFETGQDRQAGSFGSYSPAGAGGGAQQSSVQQQLQASQARQLEAQRRAMQSMYQSESMGVDTAQELVRQGEVLNRTEEKLDHIESVQKESQKHINNLSSVFGGFKNWFRGDSAKKSQQQQRQYQPPGDSLNAAMATSSTAQARRQITEEPAAFGSASTGAAGYQQQQQRQQPQTGYDTAFGENLTEMEHGMGRLKHLALGLGSEIDRQNVQLERMSEKTDRTNSKMDEQNTQMNRILYGSKAPPPTKK